MTNKFDPNESFKQKEYVWATFIPNRRPRFKCHATLAQATSALKYRSNFIDSDYIYKYVPDDCTLWLLVDGKWVETDFKRKYNDRDREKLL